MDTVLPPCKDIETLKERLAQSKPQDYADALQIAWLAHCSGESPSKAVDAFNHRENYRTYLHPSFTDAGINENGEKEINTDLPDAA